MQFLKKISFLSFLLINQSAVIAVEKIPLSIITPSSSDNYDDDKGNCNSQNFCFKKPSAACCVSLGFFGLFALIDSKSQTKTIIKTDQDAQFFLDAQGSSVIKAFNMTAGGKKTIGGYNWNSMCAKTINSSFVCAEEHILDSDNCNQRKINFKNGQFTSNCDEKEKKSRRLRGNQDVSKIVSTFSGLKLDQVMTKEEQKAYFLYQKSIHFKK